MELWKLNESRVASTHLTTNEVDPQKVNFSVLIGEGRLGVGRVIHNGDCVHGTICQVLSSAL